MTCKKTKKSYQLFLFKSLTKYVLTYVGMYYKELLQSAGTIRYNLENNIVMLHQVSTCMLEDERRLLAQFKGVSHSQVRLAVFQKI